MTEKAKEFVLDEEAEKLYQMLGGIDTRDRTLPVSYESDGLIESLAEEEKLLETWRTLLIELAHNFASFIQEADASGDIEKHKGGIGAVLGSLAQVAAMPGQDGRILIRFRGNLSGDTSTGRGYDYSINSGHVIVDLPLILELSKQGHHGSSQLPEKLTQAYKVFAGHNINSIFFAIGRWSQADADRMQASLRALSRFFQDKKINSTKPGETSSTLVFNEHGQDDANLTMLASVNRLKKSSLQQIVQKVAQMMYHSDDPKGLEQFTSAYEAIFGFKKFREQLQKPALELNNILWLLSSRGEKFITREKARLSHAVMELFGSSPLRAAQIIGAIYGTDYRYISVKDLLENLNNLTEFLHQVDQKIQDPTILKETLSGVDIGFDRLPEGVLSALDIEDNQIRAKEGVMKEFTRKFHGELVKMLSFFKKRSVTNKKLKQILDGAIDFDNLDLEIIAKDFGITTDEAGRLVLLFRDCFTAQGRFNRKNFEKNIPAFLKFEKKVFSFLWQYLKEFRHKEDRVVFLNSLQLLIAEMAEPHKALQVLLDDFTKDCGAVNFSDRNGLILANILIRKYNQELHNHIELTPEEVLLVQEGLNREMVASAAEFIDNDPERFFKKSRTLHKKLIEALQAKKDDGSTLPFHYLTTLERELYILLSLVSGMKAHKIIRSVVREYGDPNSIMYSHAKDPEQMKAIFQLLQLAVRGLARFGDSTDISLLQVVSLSEQAFIDLAPNLLPRDQVKRVMGYVNESIKIISAQLSLR